VISEPEKSNTRAVLEVNGGCKMRFLREAAGTYASARFSDNLPSRLSHSFGRVSLHAIPPVRLAFVLARAHDGRQPRREMDIGTLTSVRLLRREPSQNRIASRFERHAEKLVLLDQRCNRARVLLAV
jgi:hypothetical protein